MKNIVRKKQYNKGAAMVVSIIIIAVLMIFAFSLILISYNLYAAQNKNLATMRNMEAANSLSIALQYEITEEDAWKNSNLWNYVRFNMFDVDNPVTSWSYYSSKKEGETGYEVGHDKDTVARVFMLDSNSGVEGLPAETTVKMYWSFPEGVSASEYQLVTDPETKMELKNGARLYVEIQCNTASQSYKVTDIYKLDIEEMIVPDDNAKQVQLDAESARYMTEDEYNTRINRNEKWTWIHEARR